MFEYIWRPGHDITKPKIIKAGMKVLWKGKQYKVLRVDCHTYPVCLGGGLRVLEKECLMLKERANK